MLRPLEFLCQDKKYTQIFDNTTSREESVKTLPSQKNIWNSLNFHIFKTSIMCSQQKVDKIEQWMDVTGFRTWKTSVFCNKL